MAVRDGVYHSDLGLRPSPAEAELLHAQLSLSLDDRSPLTAKTGRPPAGFG